MGAWTIAPWTTGNILIGAVAAPADTTQTLALARGVLTRREPEPTRQMTTARNAQNGLAVAGIYGVFICRRVS